MTITSKTPSEIAIKLACERAGVGHEYYKKLPPYTTSFKAILAHARDIERWEPHLCVDPIRAEAERMVEAWDYDPAANNLVDLVKSAIRRGREMGV